MLGLKGLIVLSFCLSALSAQAPFTVKEYMNQQRVNEPAFCGVAFNRGEVTNLQQLALYRGSTQIPAQFSKLVRFEDGSYQWVLCDFVDNFNAGEEKAYTVRTETPTTVSAASVTVSRSGSTVTMDNGVIRFEVDTVDFAGIKNLTYNGTQMIGASGGGFSLRDEVTGQTYKNGTVTKAQFLTIGALRASLRVEGEFYRDSCGGIGFYYLIDVYAGSPRIRMEVQIRNSINSSCGRMAKIKRSFVALPLAFTPTVVKYDTVFKTDYNRKLDTAHAIRGYENGTVGMAVLEKCAGGFYTHFLANQIQNGNTVEVDIIKEINRPNTLIKNEFGYQDSVYKLLDLGTKNSELFIEFYSGSKSSLQLGTMAFRLKSRMVGRPDPKDLSSKRALSAGTFGTLDDEINSYNKWGWSFAENQKPFSAPQPDANIGTEDIHYESETDNAACQLLQWIRTGQRGFFDYGEAWSRYNKTWYAFRTHGFEHDGSYTILSNQYWCATSGAKYCKRFRQIVGGEPSYWTDWGISRVDVEAWSGCHFYGAGVLDYYCLTGDLDALEGGIDLGEIAWLFSNDKARGDTLNSANAGDRATGRQLLHFVRLYEVQRDSASWYRANYRSKMVLRSKNMDNRGFLRYSSTDGNWYNRMITQNGFPDSLKTYLAANPCTLVISRDTALVVTKNDRWPIYSQGGSWEQTYVQTAIERFYQFSGDEDARDYVIGFAEHGAKNLHYKCGHVPYIALFDFPRKNDLFGFYSEYTNWDPAHNICVNNQSTVSGTLPPHEGWYTLYYTNACALGYKYTGKSFLLKKAYDDWNLGSKRGYQSSYYFKPENQVYKFAYHNPVKDDALSNTTELFREATCRLDTIAPQPVTNLGVARNGTNTGLVFSWTAPADNGGKVKEYQLKYFKGKRLCEYDDYNYRTNDSTHIPFVRAVNVKGEPIPAVAGVPEMMEVIGSFSKGEVYYAAICSRDSAGNISPISNVVRIDSLTIAAEKGNSISNPLMLSCKPNPFNPSISITFYPGNTLRRNTSVSVFDAAGRLIRIFKCGDVVPGKKFSVVWDGCDENGNKLGSGVYAVRVTGESVSITRKIVMVK